MDMDWLYFGITKEAIPVKATIITITFDTIPTLTANSPNIRAPTILTASPIGFGSLIPAFLSTSKVKLH